MERDGLLRVAEDRHLELTDAGRQVAIAVMRKHRLAECLLSTTLKLPKEKVHEEACRWEHVISDDVERRLYDVLDAPTHSPFGTPIPGLPQLGVNGSEPQMEGKRLTDLARNELVTAKILMFNEVLQSDSAVMANLRNAGIVPGKKIHAVVNDRNATVSVGDETVAIPVSLAHAIVVE